MPSPNKPRSARRARQTLPTGPAAETTASTRTHPTHDDIAARAYELFMRRGGQHGSDWEDWLLAEHELMTSVPRERPSADRAGYAS